MLPLHTSNVKITKYVQSWTVLFTQFMLLQKRNSVTATKN